MFKHGGGGDNIGEKYTQLMGCICLARGVQGHAPPPRNFFKWCNLVRFGVYLDQILSVNFFLKLAFFISNF